MHDPEVFDKPMEFMPERYLTEDGKINTKVRDPEAGAFGYGRRSVTVNLSTTLTSTKPSLQHMPGSTSQQ